MKKTIAAGELCGAKGMLATQTCATTPDRLTGDEAADDVPPAIQQGRAVHTDQQGLLTSEPRWLMLRAALHPAPQRRTT